MPYAVLADRGHRHVDRLFPSMGRRGEERKLRGTSTRRRGDTTQRSPKDIRRGLVYAFGLVEMATPAFATLADRASNIERAVLRYAVLGRGEQP
jgi:hypothetical protein